MKTSTKEIVLILGGGVSALVVFVISAMGGISEILAGVLMATGLVLALLGSMKLARRQAMPWTRTKDSKSPWVGKRSRPLSNH